MFVYWYVTLHVFLNSFIELILFFSIFGRLHEMKTVLLVHKKPFCKQAVPEVSGRGGIAFKNFTISCHILDKF